MSERRKVVSVIGNRAVEEGSLRYKLAFETGKALVDNGYRVQSGGLGGIMRAVMKGAHASEKYKEGDTIALVPSFDTEIANEYADISVPTGLDVMRNALVANADAVIGIGGGAGTLCEYSFAWSFNRLVIAFENSGGWSEKMAGTRLDDVVRYENIPDDKVYGVTSPEQAIAILKERINLYTRRHQGIGKV
jgi:rossmann fold nucleotide-binding protein-like protein